MRTLFSLCAVIIIYIANAVAAEPQSAYCSFTDGNEVSVQYEPMVREQPRNGKIWSPGITLYVQTPLTLGTSQIGLGAYSVHLLPDKKAWTLIVSKNVTAGAAYDASQDVARALMEVGEIPEPLKTLQLSFGHMAPKECSLRVYYQKTGAFADFKEQ